MLKKVEENVYLEVEMKDVFFVHVAYSFAHLLDVIHHLRLSKNVTLIDKTIE